MQIGSDDVVMNALVDRGSAAKCPRLPIPTDLGHQYVIQSIRASACNVSTSNSKNVFFAEVHVFVWDVLSVSPSAFTIHVAH